jgi:hypothetical protein
MMPTVQEQLFEDFVHFAATHGSGAVYQRDPHQSVPPGYVFVRFRAPGEGSFTFAGLVQFRQREEGLTACKTFVASRDQPLELRMNFPREIPQNFSSPTFAEAHQVAQSPVAPVATRLGLLVALGVVQRCHAARCVHPEQVPTHTPGRKGNINEPCKD